MSFTKNKLTNIYNRTDGYCHICRKKLARKNYGTVNARGAWEVEHSIPHAKGGLDHLNNLYPACVSCNRSKGASSSRSSRRKHGYKAAPLPKAAKKLNSWYGGLSGALLGGALLGPFGIVAGALLGVAVGGSVQPN